MAKPLYSTNCFNTLIRVAEDCPAQRGEEPQLRGGQPTVAVLQFRMIAGAPYKYTSDDVVFATSSSGREDPGYIKAYPVGVRENGGQYTHAALWTVWALAEMGMGDKAYEVFQTLNPINHSRTPAEAEEYRVEPYVIAADVYRAKPYVGMGGWTWYTGSSGWMYRLIVEAMLGIHKQGEKLYLKPHLPAEWKDYRMTYRYGEAVYHIEIQNDKDTKTELFINGEQQEHLFIPLAKERSTLRSISRNWWKTCI